MPNYQEIEETLKKLKISSDENIDSVISLIDERDHEIQKELESALARQSSIETSMSSFRQTLNDLKNSENEAMKLFELIKSTASLSESVSSKVRVLDTARSRVAECQQRVQDLIDIELCAKGVIAAIKDEDFEQGAIHVRRFLSMDQNLLQRTAEDVSESVTTVSEAVRILEDATIKMRELINQKFEEAVRKDDLASVERFFKIYPLLNRHHEGIEKFSSYISLKLEKKSQKELRNSIDIAKAEKRQAVAFADTLTSLLENFARVIEVNQPIIESCYGCGYLFEMFLILQNECDKEVKNLLLEFNKHRQIAKKVGQINEYLKSGSSGSQNSGHYRHSSGGGSVDKISPKDVDALAIEITIMHSRAELYYKFMKRRLFNDIQKANSDENEKDLKKKKCEETIMKCGLSRQMQELLGTYLLFERYFMEESVLKAIALDTYENGQQCSSMVDDVFYILRKSIRRSITTQSVNGICAVINNAATCFEGDFINALKNPLKTGYPSGYIDLAQAYNVIQSSIQQGKIQTSDSEQARTNFLVQLNNADMSTEFIETLWVTMSEEIQASFPSMTKTESQILDSCMTELKSVKDMLKAVVDFGLQQLKSSAIKPRLNPWVDQFLSYNHHLTEEELSTYEAGETFVQFLIVQIDSLLNTFKPSLSPRNYDALVSILASEVTSRLERAIKKSTFNRLGGLILDQEVRALGSYLTGATSWSVRDKMARLTQIATLLNLEKVSEITEYWNPNDGNDMPTWRLTPNEVRTILTLRSDFRMEDIKRIKI
ncbi:conserved oligomeric Golgi complex subunit 4 [Condylostylus longicornis]|uniref:conserved oligomeric Golgi complex subunit 4 n=1 Tax=Condylostylus longicornis TaxID=2530218 RepID=UPI00244DA7AC|nr:conserved oligomeric Golgi complex subunit 4 [Condylostylus longicornis]